MFPSYRNQSVDLLRKSADWFLYDGNVGRSWVKLNIRLGILASNLTSLVIRQKGEFQNGCFQKAKHAKFSEKRTFLTPLIRGKWHGVNVRFSENLACFAFLLPPFWHSPFCLITDVMWSTEVNSWLNKQERTGRWHFRNLFLVFVLFLSSLKLALN